MLRALQRLGEQAAHAGRIVQRIREFLTRRELARQRVQLTLALDPHLPMVVADAVLIEQVVINLIRNACDALAEQPEAPERPRTIAARTRSTPDRRFVRIDVCDNGPGLQGRRIEALCAPFYSTKTEGMGMGMGLAICRSILKAHQGALDAVEAPAGGAWFSMPLPVDLQLSVGAPEATEFNP